MYIGMWVSVLCLCYEENMLILANRHINNYSELKRRKITEYELNIVFLYLWLHNLIEKLNPN